MKRAGELDLRMALQRKSISYSNSGEPIETWQNIAVVWMGLRPLTGIEVNSAEQWVAREQQEFTIRWSNTVDDVSPMDRIVFPASDAGASPEITRSIYDIIAVHEIGRHEDLKIIAARRVG